MFPEGSTWPGPSRIHPSQNRSFLKYVCGTKCFLKHVLKSQSRPSFS